MQRDFFNGSTPARDATNTNLVGRVLEPELPALIESIYGIPAPKAPRNDLVEIFVTGVAKNAPTLDGSKPPIQADLNSQVLNKDADPKKFAPSEMIRLNMGVPVTATPNRLGVLGGDLQGFPNGRRLTDDVVDIELQALEGAVQNDGSAKIVPALAKGDGVDVNPRGFSKNFPYVGLPFDQSVNTAGTGTERSVGSRGRSEEERHRSRLGPMCRANARSGPLQRNRETASRAHLRLRDHGRRLAISPPGGRPALD